LARVLGAALLATTLEVSESEAGREDPGTARNIIRRNANRTGNRLSNGSWMIGRAVLPGVYRSPITSRTRVRKGDRRPWPEVLILRFDYLREAAALSSGRDRDCHFERGSGAATISRSGMLLS